MSESDKIDNNEAVSNAGIRLNKYIANAGICSRRKADEFIANGDVKVNNEVVLEMGYKVQPLDQVFFKDKLVEQKGKPVYILLNKPKNYITTTSDEKGRKTVLDLIKKATDERVYPVGRLDRNTTGLLLITNDGDLAHKLSHPSSNTKKLYYVVLDNNVKNEHIELIRSGKLKLEDGEVMVDEINYVAGKDKSHIGIELHIGKNRIVRRIFEHFGYKVLKLDRVMYAGLTKKDLQRGWWRMLNNQEVIQLKYLKKT